MYHGLQRKKNKPQHKNHILGAFFFTCWWISQQALLNYEVQMGRDQMTDRAIKGLISRGL